jgi:hypothetical protein
MIQKELENQILLYKNKLNKKNKKLNLNTKMYFISLYK